MNDNGQPVVQIQNLHKTFRIPFLHVWKIKRVLALRGIDLSFDKGEIIGFLGPNGAGKTTTIKILMGLVRPTAGRVRIQGTTIWDVPAKAKPFRRYRRLDPAHIRRLIGYLPEQPYFYDFLKPQELLEHFGQIYRIPRKTRRERIDRLLQLVGLSDARSLSLRKFSRGMLQRIGIAQALMNDPELLVLDEPLSGLDPTGRKEIRDLIVDLGRRGKTVFFSSHILHDLELVCDQVAFIIEGKVVKLAPMEEILSQGENRDELVLQGTTAEFDGEVERLVERRETIGSSVRLEVQNTHTADVVQAALRTGARLVSLTPKRPSLEEVFVLMARGER